jgi:hypothetical protein
MIKMDRITTLFLSTGLLLVAHRLNVKADGGCFFHCIIARFSQLPRSKRMERQIPEDSDRLRIFLCEHLMRYSRNKIPGLGLSPFEYFEAEYSENARKRQCLHNSCYNQIIIERGLDLQTKPLFVDTFEKYMDWMQHPNTHVDGLIVAFAASFLDMNLKVYTRAISEVQHETSDIPEVSHLISMGFSRTASEKVLLESGGNVEAAIEKLLQMQVQLSGPSEAKRDVWYEQPYGSDSGWVSISMIQDENHFQLILPDKEQQSSQSEDLSTDPLRELVSMGFSREKAGKSLSEAGGDMAAAIENLLSPPRVTLPEISAELLFEPEMTSRQRHVPPPFSVISDEFLFEPEMTLRKQHVPPPSFGYTQCNSLLTSPHQFYDACKSKTSSESFPKSTEVHVSFNAVYCDLNHDYLFGSIMLGDHHDVRYRVVSFTMMDRSIVAYHGPIENLSRKSEKLAFFSQLYPVIHHQDVISVRIARLN